MSLNLRQALRAKPNSVIALSGAGGKTTSLFTLAQEYPSALLAAACHMGGWQAQSASQHISLPPGSPPPPPSAPHTLYTGLLDPQTNRLGGLTANQLQTLHQMAKDNNLPLLLEADGARQKMLKAPADHEPNLPLFTELCVTLIGLTTLGKPLNEENVHRSQIFSALTGLPLNQIIQPQHLTRLLQHPQGGLKNIPSGARRVALLNQAETPFLQAAAGQMAQEILPSYHAVLVASLQKGEIYAAKERVAGVILAAGEAKRMGKPKQLLSYQGEPFVRRVAKTALQAGLSPVIVITGAYAPQVEAALIDLPNLHLLHNPHWQSGQSASVRAGVQTLQSQFAGVGGAIFLLADQPQVNIHLLQALMEQHAQSLAPILAPLAADRRANPVLFDQTVFDDLLTIQGDAGGRVLFRQYPLRYIPWMDESLLLDVDTEEDYRKLLAWGIQE